MPWIPVIGRSLADVGQQYWNVAQSNLRTQEGDIARANAAQQNANRWHANVADLLSQQESDRYRRQLHSDQIARRDFEWGVDQKHKQAEIGLKRQQFNRALDDERLAEGDEVNAIEFAKQRVSETGDAFDQATRRLESSKRAFDERFNEAQKKLPAGLVKFDRATGSYTLDPMAIGGKTDVEKAELNVRVAKVNDELTGRFSEYSLAQQEHKNVSDLFNQAQSGLPSGAQVGKKDGKWVINSPRMRKTFSWEAPAARPTAPQGSGMFSPVMGDVRMAETATATAPAPRWTPPGSVQNQSLTPQFKASKITEARRAISLGANPQAVAERLRQKYGIVLE